MEHETSQYAERAANMPRIRIEPQEDGLCEMDIYGIPLRDGKRDPRWLAAAAEMPAEEWTEEALDRLAADVAAETSIRLGDQTGDWLDGWFASQLECVSTVRRAYRAGIRDGKLAAKPPMLGVAILITLALIAGIVGGVALASVVG